MKNYILTFVFSALSLLATAQTFTEKNLDDITQGLLKDPIGFLKANTAPDYTLTSNGQVSDLKTVLARFEALKLVSWVVSDVKIRQYGTTAITTGTAKHSYIVNANGASVSFADLFTYVSAYQNKKWLIVAGQHSDIPLDQMKEETAIKTSIEAESKAYHAGDAEGLQSQWLFTPQTRAAGSTPSGQLLYFDNGESLKAFYAKVAKPTNQTFSNANYKIKINRNGQTAYVTNDQTTSDAAGKTLFLSRYAWYLEKVNGVWKIAGMSLHHYSDSPTDQNKGQTFQKGNLVGIRNITVELKPNVTMEQVIDFYNTRWIPDADKYFGFKCFVGKCLRGTDCAENKLRLIFHFKTEAERDKYFKMAEGGRDLNELGAKAWAQFAPTDNALQQLATIKFDWADWLIK